MLKVKHFQTLTPHCLLSAYKKKTLSDRRHPALTCLCCQCAQCREHTTHERPCAEVDVTPLRTLLHPAKAHAATKDQTGLTLSHHVDKRAPKREKSKVKRNKLKKKTKKKKKKKKPKKLKKKKKKKKNKPSSHMKKRWAVPETLGCLQRCDPYLIATSGRRVALFIPPHRSDCMLWLLQSGSAQFWGSACLFGHSPVCSLSRANWRNPRQNCHCQSCYYHRASSVLDNDNKTHTANAHSALENKTGHTSVRVKNWLGLAYYLKKKKKKY